MRISRGRADGALSETRTETFTGTVLADPVMGDQDGVVINTVVFPPGARTNWHTHGQGQILIVTAGEGRVVSRDGESWVIRTGDVVHIPGGEVHWHGAGPTTLLTHLAISLQGTDWLEPVSDEDYDRAAGA
jgi:quercetin dioxygenase-like cupin family protein